MAPVVARALRAAALSAMPPQTFKASICRVMLERLRQAKALGAKALAWTVSLLGDHASAISGGWLSKSGSIFWRGRCAGTQAQTGARLPLPPRIMGLGG